VAQFVETLHYKPGVGGFDSRRGHLSFKPHGSTQSLTEMNTRSISLEVKAAGA